VAAQHDDDRASVALCGSNRVDDAQKITRDEDVGE